jgi:hypothetical protein
MDDSHQCLNCKKTEDEAPILTVHFKGSEVGICASCLPILIHKPQQLAGRLEGADEIEPSSHSHD